jgi:hypothetical protein
MERTKIFFRIFHFLKNQTEPSCIQRSIHKHILNQQTLLPVSFLISSLRLFLLRAQTAMLVQPSPSDLVSDKSWIFSILRTRSEKLLLLKANAKSESDLDPHASSTVEKSESMIVQGSKRSALNSLMPKPWKSP